MSNDLLMENDCQGDRRGRQVVVGPFFRLVQSAAVLPHIPMAFRRRAWLSLAANSQLQQLANKNASR